MVCCFLSCTLFFGATSFEQHVQEVMPHTPLYNLIQEQDFLEAETLVLNKIQEVREDVQKKAELLALLSCLYVKDQKEELAFTTFLEALHCVPQASPIQLAGKEKQLFEKYLDLYIHTPQPTQEQAEAFAQEIGPYLEKHPDYHFLRLLYACSFANRKQYDEFFCNFFSSYIHAPDTYLIPRTLAILHVKLFERARTCEEKNRLKKQIVSFLEQAVRLYDRDTTVYKLLLVFAPEESRKETYQEVLRKILLSGTIIPRSEISFYINCALAVEEYEKAEELLSKMKGWHGYSRAIEEMQNQVKDLKKNNG
jgi:hypothetical protein